MSRLAEGKKDKLQFHYDTVELPIEKISPNNWNPNFVTEDMMNAIIDDIERHGFIGDIVVQKFNKAMGKPYVIINGEHRYEALKRIGIRKIPTIILDIKDKTAKLLTLRLNREHGELMPDKVSTILGDLVEGENLKSEDELGYLGEITRIPETDLDLLRNIKFSDVDIPEQDLEVTHKGTVNKKVDDENTIYLDWYDIEKCVVEVANKLKEKYDDIAKRYNAILAIPNGGLVPARLLARELDFYENSDKNILTSLDKTYKNVLVVDDIYDTGQTYNLFQNLFDNTKTKFDYLTLVIRNGQQKPYNVYWSRDLEKDKRWVVFPWEGKQENRRKNIKSILSSSH